MTAMPAPRPPRPAAFTYRLTVEYDGTRFSGWQEQKNARTVAGELKRALADAGFPPLELGGAGRTDAGVHALAQVAHLRLPKKTDPPSLANALNARLPGSLHVLAVEPAEPRFHARHEAVARSYLYQLSRRRTAFAKPFVWWVKEPLEAGRLAGALALLPGRHDFRLFCEAAEAAGSTLVEVERAEMAEQGDLVLLRLVASHFLWRMVRRLVGTLVQVGTGRLALASFTELLAGRPLAAAEDTPARWTAPASGLFLERVLYPGDPPLAGLTAVTPLPSPPDPAAGLSVARPPQPPRGRQPRRPPGSRPSRRPPSTARRGER
jgi:tRNA pseudouridine38-40 synthase